MMTIDFPNGKKGLTNMGTNRYPMITSDVVELLEQMRHAQRDWEELVNNRDGRVMQHQIRRALQAKQSAERKVDVWLANYEAEMQGYLRAMGEHKTDELPGL